MKRATRGKQRRMTYVDRAKRAERNERRGRSPFGVRFAAMQREERRALKRERQEAERSARKAVFSALRRLFA